MKTIARVSCMFMLLVSACAASPKEVTYQSGNDTVKGLLYTPEGKGPLPAIIVIHEWFGVNDWVKEQAAKLADQGYVALAVDLYRGKVAATSDEAHELSRGLPEDRAVRDLDAAFHFLQAQPNVKKDRIGSIGWCMGGGYSLAVALEEPELAADVINYGSLVTDSEALKKIHARILGLFGAQDRGIPPADVKKFEQQLRELGKQVDITIYPGAGHQFENPNNKQAYRASDAADAWAKTLNFLSSTLRK